MSLSLSLKVEREVAGRREKRMAMWAKCILFSLLLVIGGVVVFGAKHKGGAHPVRSSRRSSGNNSSSGSTIINNDGCDYFKGRWVVDFSFPLYDPSLCPFIQKEFSCLKNGRRDILYLHYGWKPLSCNLARYLFPHSLPFFF